MRIAVAGATGVVGRHIVEVAQARGHEVVRLARATGVDLTSGQGLVERLDGVRTVVDATSVATRDRATAEEFFGSVSRHLLSAGATAGVGHHVVLSIVGIDGLDLGYYQGKQHQERVVAAGEVPWSILRATQFHEFAEQILGAAKVGPVSLVPRMLSQPIAAREVAGALVELAESGAQGRVPDLAGPHREQMVDLARRVVRARRLRRLVVPVTLPGETGRAMRDGALVPSADGPRGTQPFAEWLASS